MEPSPRPRRRPRRQLSSSSPTPAAAREPRRCRRPVGGEVHVPPMAPSPPPAPTGAPSAAPPAAAETTIDSLSDDNIEQILLRLPSWLSLARAGAVCRRWANPRFRKSFRKLHPSSALIGIFACDESNECVSRPIIHYVDKRNSDIAVVIDKGDFPLTKLGDEDERRWRLRDCRNGVLLLRRDAGSLCVYNPVSGEQPVRIQPCSVDVTIDEREFVADCLLPGTVKQCVAVDSFRVVSVQEHGREIRAVEYDSATSEWRCHPWVSPFASDGLSRKPQWGRPMYAAGHIFWVYGIAYLFVLDTRANTMEFKSRPLPGELVEQKYSIGEIEDGEGCLVCFPGLEGEKDGRRLQVWSLDNVLELDLKKEVHVPQVLEIPWSTSVCKVINGLVLMTTRRTGRHYVIDLHKGTVVAKFKYSGRGYPYQLSWRPAIPPLEDNNIDTPQDDGPRERKKRKMKYANKGLLLAYKKMKRRFISTMSNGCPGETSCDPLVVESEIVSTTAVPQNSPRDPCRDILVGQEATSQDKPLSEDVLNCPQRGGSPKKSRRKAVAHPKGARRTCSSVVHDSTSVEAETTSTPAVRHTNQGARCRNSSAGRPARHEKPLHKITKPKKRHAPSMRTFTCRFEGCPGEFPTKHKKDIHEKSSVHVKKPFACPTSTCHKSYDSNWELKHHLSTHGSPQFSCPYESCSSSFYDNSKRNRHIREIHRRLKPFPCKSCDKKFTRAEFLKSHVELLHKRRNTPLLCRYKGCGEVFTSKHAREKHEKSHLELDGATRIKCVIKGCPSTFSWKSHYTRHYKEKHMKTSASCGESGRQRKKKT